MNTFLLVQEFNRKFNIAVLPLEDLVNGRDHKALLQLRLNLLLEEVGELCCACGAEVNLNTRIEEGGVFSSGYNVQIHDTGALGVDEIADALGDIDYVTAGFALALGIPHNDVVLEIHQSNMSKLDAVGKPILRGDGKVLKGPNYFKPRIQQVLSGKIVHITAHCDFNTSHEFREATQDLTKSGAEVIFGKLEHPEDNHPSYQFLLMRL